MSLPVETPQKLDSQVTKGVGITKQIQGNMKCIS